jgi:pre-mRNA-splicing factor SPF27
VCNVCRSIDQLNRERKLQQQAAGAELRVLEDQYYSTLRKNLEISAACQSIEEEMELLQAKIGRIEKKQQQEEEQQKQQEEQQKGGEQQPEGGGGVDAAEAADEVGVAAVAAEEGPVANGVADEEQQEKQPEQPAEQQPEAPEGPADMEQ